MEHIVCERDYLGLISRGFIVLRNKAFSGLGSWELEGNTRIVCYKLQGLFINYVKR